MHIHAPLDVGRSTPHAPHRLEIGSFVRVVESVVGLAHNPRCLGQDLCACVCACVCVYACVCVCMYVDHNPRCFRQDLACISQSIYPPTYLSIFLCAHTWVRTHTHARTHIHIHANTHTRAIWDAVAEDSTLPVRMSLPCMVGSACDSGSTGASCSDARFKTTASASAGISCRGVASTCMHARELMATLA